VDGNVGFAPSQTRYVRYALFLTLNRPRPKNQLTLVLEHAMSSDGDEFGRIASAEKQLCDQAGPLLAEIVRGVEERYGIRIAELRVTMGASEPGNGWSGANCVIVRQGNESVDLASGRSHWGAKVHQALAKR
jgi:hypothetical protein